MPPQPVRTKRSNKTTRETALSSARTTPEAKANDDDQHATSGSRQEQKPIVASLEHQSQFPYSSISVSPSRRFAIAGSKDILNVIEIKPTGLSIYRTIPTAPHFQVNHQAARTFDHGAGSSGAPGDTYFVREAFGFGQKNANNTQSNSLNVVITRTAWSRPSDGKRGGEETTSLIAAAGSNGVVIVWNAETVLRKQPSMVAAPPEAVLSQHTRTVNELTWHPTKHGLLLSASQDGKVILWERRTVATTNSQETTGGFKMLFGGIASHSKSKPAFSWHCRAVFEPKSEAVRGISWSPFHEDVFGLVTTSGALIIYNMVLPARAILKMTAHATDATSLDWHPTKAGILATGSTDRSVKVWDIEGYLNMNRDDSNMGVNQNTMTSRSESVHTEGSDNEYSNMSFTVNSASALFSSVAIHPSSNRTISSAPGSFSKHKDTPMHVLYISASVTRVRWRPPANDAFAYDEPDRHESMLAVATAPVKGVGAGGSGFVALLSCNRPYMPLSIVEGHQDGAVTDFVWLDTPRPDKMHSSRISSPSKASSTSESRQRRRGDSNDNSIHKGISRHGSHEMEGVMFDTSEHDDPDNAVGIWQHVLSVGRDGRCLLQSLAQGERPIAKIPPTCFAMANLSPFQKGYGSLQIFSVCQEVPSGSRDDYILSGLRADTSTAHALGVFREDPQSQSVSERENTYTLGEQSLSSGRVPSIPPNLVFNVVDQGDLDDEALPVEDSHEAIVIGPEVVHLSRFASQYILAPDDEVPNRVSLCFHNASVAERLRCSSLAHMWRMVGSILESAGLDGLPDDSTPANAMQFVILPTLKSLLEERADAGDVQTCVALCEVLQVVRPDQTCRIPDLEISLVREWYLSYIDLLRDMCLFSHASSVIRACKDPYIAALNQQSTTIHESCPNCGKALLTGDGVAAGETDNARRTCKSCRRRIGLCFLCHEPVKGMYVWCPGCGHGGHLDHALQWFGGLAGKSVREMCPTGCGHKCNSFQQLSAFPRTESMRDLILFPDQGEVSLGA